MVLKTFFKSSTPRRALCMCVVWCDMCVHTGLCVCMDTCIKEQLLSTQSRCYALTHKLGLSFSLDSSGAAVPDAYKDSLETGHQLLAKRS